MSWDEISARMDEDVDAHVADTIAYSTDGTAFTNIPGFVLFEGEGLEGAFEGALQTSPRVKIRASLLPAGGPVRSHRLKATRLPGGANVIYRPSTDKPDEQGRYIIFDVQKV